MTTQPKCIHGETSEHTVVGDFVDWTCGPLAPIEVNSCERCTCLTTKPLSRDGLCEPCAEKVASGEWPRQPATATKPCAGGCGRLMTIDDPDEIPVCRDCGFADMEAKHGADF